MNDLSAGRRLSRSAFLGGMVGAAAIMANAADAGAETAPALLKIGTYLADTGAQPLFAERMNFFKTAALDARVTILASGAALVPAVVAGSLDVGCSTIGTIAAAHERGLPLVIFAAGALYSSAAPTTVIVVERTSAIRTAKDLNGKTVGVNGLRDLISVATQTWIAQNGGDPSTVRFVEIPFPEQGPALQRGTVDAIAGAEPAISIAKLRYGAIPIGYPYDIVNAKKPFLISAWFSTNEWLTAHAATAKRFIDALSQTSRWANANPAASAAVLGTHISIPPEVLKTMARATFTTVIDPSQIQPSLDISYKAKLLANPVDARTLIAKI